MIELAIDTSTDVLSLALAEDRMLLGEFVYHAPRDHMRYLLPGIDLLLRRSKKDISQLGRIIIGTGPGSFTGLRIGASCAQALAMVLMIGITGIPSFDAIAQSFNQAEQVIHVVADAKKGQLYHCRYRFHNGRLIRADKIKTSSPLDFCHLVRSAKDERYFLAGDACIAYSELFKAELKNKAIFTPSALWIPRAKNLLLLAEDKVPSPEVLPFVRLNYLRSPIQIVKVRR